MRKTKILRGTTYVFANLGFPDPEIHFLKAQLMGRVQDGIRDSKLDQAEAARTMGISAFEFSEMLKGQFREASIEQIIRMLIKLGCGVNLDVKPRGAEITHSSLTRGPSAGAHRQSLPSRSVCRRNRRQ